MKSILSQLIIMFCLSLLLKILFSGPKILHKEDQRQKDRSLIGHLKDAFHKFSSTPKTPTKDYYLRKSFKNHKSPLLTPPASKVYYKKPVKPMKMIPPKFRRPPTQGKAILKS